MFPSTVDADVLTARLVDLEARQRLLDEERADVLAQWDRSKAWAVDGSATPAARLARECGLAGGEARARVKVARLLASSMPVTRAAFAALGWPKVKVLAAAIDERTAAAFAAHEDVLVDQAMTLTVDQLAIFIAHWRRLVDVDGANRSADAQHEQSFFRVSASFGGEVFLDGRLDPEAAAVVKSALDQIAEELFRAEHAERAQAAFRGEDPPAPVKPSHRYALALREMAERSMAVTAAEADGRPVAPAKPLVLVTIDVDLFGETMKIVRARLAGGEPLDLADAARLACDAAVAKVLTSRGVVPLHLGRATRDPSEGQRRALSAIWSTCAFPGCDRPFAWCELHHTWHWDAGGPTDVDRLLPLCPHHHRHHHRGVFAIHRRPDSTFWFERADGAFIGDANPTVSQMLGGLRDLQRRWASAA